MKSYPEDTFNNDNLDKIKLKDRVSAKPKVIWWNEDCSKATRLRKAALIL